MPAPVTTGNVPFELTPHQIEEAKEAVKAALKDPESAQFSGIYGVGNPVLKAKFSVCGQVNAKNSFGGYSGRQPFVVTGGRATLLTNDFMKDLYRWEIDSRCTIPQTQ